MLIIRALDAHGNKMFKQLDKQELCEVDPTRFFEDCYAMGERHQVEVVGDPKT